MAKVILFVLFLVILISGVLVIYYFVEKPLQQENDLKEFNIYAKYNSKNVKTGILILNEGEFYKEDITDEQGGRNIKLPINSSFLISNFNINNQTFYKEIKFITSSSNDTSLITFNLF